MSENTLNLVTGILEILLLLSAIVLAVYLIIFLKKFLKSISSIENEIVEISDQLAPVIRDAKLITDDIKEMVERSRIQFHKAEDVTERLTGEGKKLVSNLTGIRKFSSGILDSISKVSAAVTGVKTFYSTLKSGHKSNNNSHSLTN